MGVPYTSTSLMWIPRVNLEALVSHGPNPAPLFSLSDCMVLPKLFSLCLRLRK
jgi:hypothetical protein